VRSVADVAPWRGLTSPNFRRAFRYLRPQLWLVGATAFFSILYLPFAVFEPLLIKYFIDKILLGQHPELMLRLGEVTFAFFLIYGLVEIGGVYCVLRLAQRLHAFIKAEQLANILAKGLNFHKNTPAGRLMYCFFNDSNQIGTLLSLGLSNAAMSVALIIVRSVILWYIAPRLLLLYFATIPAQAIIMYRVLRRVMRFQIQLKAKDEDLTARIETLLRSAATVKSFGFAGPLSHIWNELFNARLGLDFNNLMWQKVGFLVIGQLHLFGTFAILFYGVYMVHNGALTLGTLLAFLTVSGRLSPSVHGLISFFVGIQETLVGLERYYMIHDLPDEAREFVQRSGAVANGRRDLGPDVLRQVAVHNVDVDHGNGRIRVPCDLQLELGKSYIWYGPNGAGKTSLALALAGLVPHARGSIVCSGVPLCDFSLPSVRENVLYVGSEPFWPERTLAENFTNSDGNGHVDQERLAEALEVSEARQIVDSLPLRMESILTTKGHILSQGEGQRLFLAMALYRRPPLLILDEALSSVAANVRQRILARLVRQPPGHMMVYISHSGDHADQFDGEARFRNRI